QLARGFGEGIREFKKSMNGDEPETPAKPAAQSESDTPAK
ncbi:MAG: twin-arginine translocase TatA/TatE family subunit, partial [Cytophagales bacterium]|nr:twin-arginine translocase TatA/TatE family subunit [Armatimonadota bacterium]